MRIVMLSQFYPPVIGGEERHVQDLGIELARRGHEVAVVTLWHEGLPMAEQDRGVRVYRIRGTTQRAGWLYKEPGRRHAPPIPDLEAVWALQQILAREQPEIVHAHNWLLHSYMPLYLWSKAGLVVSLHDYSLACAKKRLMYQGRRCSGPKLTKCIGCAMDHFGMVKGTVAALGNRVMGAIERNVVDIFLPVSQAVAYGNDLVARELPFQVIPNFVADAIDELPPLDDPRLDQLPDGEFLLFVGDLSAEKGIYVLLQAYAQLRDAPPLVLIGRSCGDSPRSLPPHVLSLGIWPHDLVMEAWRRGSIALVPSVWPEPFGITAIEAMAAGCPTIAARSGGLTDIVLDGETGLLVPPGDAEALGKAMQRLIDEPALRARLGQVGQRRSAEFRASVIVPRIEQVYQSVIATLPARVGVWECSDTEGEYRQV
jgi:glycosyltransferase involved in cell wall biosynthesis